LKNKIWKCQNRHKICIHIFGCIEKAVYGEKHVHLSESPFKTFLSYGCSCEAISQDLKIIIRQDLHEFVCLKRSFQADKNYENWTIIEGVIFIFVMAYILLKI